MNPTCVAVAALLPLLAAVSAVAAMPKGETADVPSVRYVVKAGDTLIGLATRALVRPGDWQAVAKANRISDPRRLPVGKALAIPLPLLRREPQDATIAAFSGQVAVDPGGAARLGLTVGAGTTVSTGANSFVTLALVDGSRVTLPSQSKVRIASLDTIVIDGRLERRFELVTGRGDFGVTPRERPEDRFLVKTPVAVAAVRGTEFRVAHDAATGKSVVGVVEGEVAGRALVARGETAIAAGTGAVLASEGVRMAKLLPPPVLLRPGKVQDDPAVVFDIAPGSMGVKRHVQLARDAGFVDLFAETETQGAAAQFDNIGNGTMYVRLTDIDADGVEGLPTVVEVERFLSGLEATAGAVPGKGPRRTQFRWQPTGGGTRVYDFVLARDEALLDRVVDAPGLTGTAMTVSGLAPGVWYWRVTVTARDGVKRRIKVFPVRSLTIARRET
nr:FecR domain-containing protein [Polymorphobacter sp.]